MKKLFDRVVRIAFSVLALLLLFQVAGDFIASFSAPTKEAAAFETLRRCGVTPSGRWECFVERTQHESWCHLDYHMVIKEGNTNLFRVTVTDIRTLPGRWNPTEFERL